MSIIAYTYEADYHCVPCAVERFGFSASESAGSVLVCDGNGIPVRAEDVEGNRLTPLYNYQEWCDGYECRGASLACGTCGDIIRETCGHEVTNCSDCECQCEDCPCNDRWCSDCDCGVEVADEDGPTRRCRCVHCQASTAYDPLTDPFAGPVTEPLWPL